MVMETMCLIGQTQPGLWTTLSSLEHLSLLAAMTMLSAGSPEHSVYSLAPLVPNSERQQCPQSSMSQPSTLPDFPFLLVSRTSTNTFLPNCSPIQTLSSPLLLNFTLHFHLPMVHDLDFPPVHYVKRSKSKTHYLPCKVCSSYLLLSLGQ